MSRPYFAYGSNMDEGQMAKRCPGATLVDGAVLEHVRFVITARGYANAVPAPNDAVVGLLWSLTDADEASMDRYEGVRPGQYRKEMVDVLTTAGRRVRALVYLSNTTEEGSPVPGYLEAIVAAARRHGLPDDYITRLEGWFPPA